MKIALAQINLLVGDIPGNADKICTYVKQAGEVDVIAFPELAVTGYPPEDLLLRESLGLRVEKALERIIESSKHSAAHIVVGYPLKISDKLYNCAGVFFQGEKKAEYRKQCLPNYRVFDEKRYFSAGDEVCVFDLNGTPTAITICEDLWQSGPVNQAKEAGAKLLLNLNASPYRLNKQVEREALLKEKAQQSGMPIAYVNLVGGQDELVFDGGSCVVSAEGNLLHRAEFFQEQLCEVELGKAKDLPPLPDKLKLTYDALVLGVRDYVNKNGFKGVVLGLSGGIDSALTLAVAVDALGPDRVEAVMMPFRYTSDMSVEDAGEQAKTLGISFHCVSIENIYESFMESLQPIFENSKKDTTEENLQARSRGVLLMAISNKKGYLVLTTGNKSEMAVGYCTLYGDMAGGFAAIKDVPKTLVYQLADYRNGISPVIPQRVIDRPPSAELAPDQKDEDSLPPYDVLDQILELYIEQDQSADAIVAKGFNEEDVRRVIRLVDVNEYKRRQAPIGVRVTQRGFGRDRRYPVTNAWHIGE